MTKKTIFDEIHDIKDLVDSINKVLVAESYPEVTLNPYGPVNLETRKQQLVDSLEKIRTSLVNFKDSNDTILHGNVNTQVDGKLPSDQKSDSESDSLINIKKILTSFKVDIGCDGNIHKAAVSYAIDDVHDEKKLFEKLENLIAKPSPAISADEILNDVNLKNGVLTKSVINHGATLNIRIPPVVSSLIKQNDLIKVICGNDINHWSLKYFQFIWFGWESNPQYYHGNSNIAIVPTNQPESSNLPPTENQDTTLVQEPQLNVGDGLSQDLTKNIESLNNLETGINVDSNLENEANKNEVLTKVASNSIIMEIEEVSKKNTENEMDVDIDKKSNITAHINSDFEAVGAENTNVEAIKDINLTQDTEADIKPMPEKVKLNCFYNLVARFEPFIWCCSSTIKSIQSAMSLDEQFSENYKSPDNTVPLILLPSGDGSSLESLVSRDSPMSENGDNNRCYTVKKIEEAQMEIAFECLNPCLQAFALCRVPIFQLEKLIDILPIIRRQIVFNELLSSCFSVNRVCLTNNEGLNELKSSQNKKYHVDVQTNPRYPFSLILRVTFIQIPSLECNYEQNNSLSDYKISTIKMDTEANAQQTCVDLDQQGMDIEDKDSSERSEKCIRDELFITVEHGGAIKAKVVFKSELESHLAGKSEGLFPSDNKITNSGLDYSLDNDITNAEANDKISKVANICCDVPIIISRWVEYRNTIG
ncbi:hypothetical protein AYI70_g11444 [Smittium culicis]|uniref:Mediator of RNA polymerase II transcription subunit 1 n=1 Tax=Smittium culicis TaxID=133412 RepID=A0A1R1X1V9_9FUNG|nr:hypothetical protein AYI70_g11444 [Smittium culicis]